MYGRDYEGRILSFEASGGLLNSSLVLQDRETDSYWSIMTGDAVAGRYEGEKLEELPGGAKVRWRDWVERHPDTLVLSVSGREHVPTDPYRGYFEDDEGFRGAEAEDRRLATKEPIYAFLRGGRAFAVPHDAATGGRVFRLEDGSSIFLHRPAGAELFLSTAAFVVMDGGFERRDGRWVEVGSGATFDPESRTFQGGSVERLGGFDTFWYTWSLTHEESEILR